jgi:hypothetical protein
VLSSKKVPSSKFYVKSIIYSALSTQH